MATPKTLEPELWLQIFHKLPIRNVVRCKEVCKGWRCLISDPFFKSNYKDTNQPLTLIKLPPQIDNLHVPTTPPLSYQIDGSDHNTAASPLVGKQWSLPQGFFNKRMVKPVGSYNGLVALYEARIESGSDSGSSLLCLLFCLFNPCTKEEKRVCVRLSIKYYDYFAWTFITGIASGICHDPVSDEYKVVVFSVSRDRFLLVSFKDGGGWKMVKKSPPTSTLECQLGTTVQGNPHWVCNATGLLFYFDWRAEEYRLAQLPKPALACGLGALDGQLTVAVAKKGGECEVWVLKEYGNDDSWRLLFVMLVDKLQPFSLLSWRKDEWVVFKFEGKDAQHELMIYDIRLRSFRPLKLNTQRLQVYEDINNVVTYFPSLVSPINH